MSVSAAVLGAHAKQRSTEQSGRAVHGRARHLGTALERAKVRVGSQCRPQLALLLHSQYAVGATKAGR